MKKLNLQHLTDTTILSREDLKNVTGGSADDCLQLGMSCNDHVQCCSAYCGPNPSDPNTGKTCQIS